MMDNEIKNLILEIRSNDRIGSFDEATTKQTIILRILNQLGWKIFDAEEVKPEHSVSNKRVDYSLRINHLNKVFLEVKKVKEDLECHQKQLLDYSFQEGVRLAVLTNGVTWWFYLPLSEGNWEQRKYFAIDISQQDPDDIAKRFIEFLSKNSIETETAVRVAENLLKGRVKDNEIRKNLPKAWEKIISEPDELLIEIINDTLEKISGHRADREQIILFINNVQNQLTLDHETQKIKNKFNGKQISNKDIFTKIGSVRTSKNFPPNGTVCKFSYKGRLYNGVIKDGRLHIEGQGSFSSFSAASVEVTKTSRNGWRDWEIKLPGDNHWQLADMWRKK
jgi:predicted type IV restriction endonuclease